LNFGTGGLVVRRAAGQNPLLEIIMTCGTGNYLKNVHFMDLTIIGQLGNSSLAHPNTFQFNGGGMNQVVKFSKIKFGRGYSTNYDPVTQWMYVPTWINAIHCYQIIVEDCDVFGSFDVVALTNIYLGFNQNLRVRNCFGDVFPLSDAYYVNTAKNVFPDNNCHFWYDDVVFYANADFIDQITNEGPHCDLFQRRAYVGAADAWYPSTAVLKGAILVAYGRTYKVETAGTTGTVAPTATSGTINDGTAVLSYMGQHTGINDTTHVVALNVTTQHNGTSYNDYGAGGSRNSTTQQTFWDGTHTSKDTFTLPMEATFINLLSGQSNTKGIFIQYGNARVEFCTFGGASTRPATLGIGGATVQVPGCFLSYGKLMVRNTILGPITSGGGKPNVTVSSAPTVLGVDSFIGADNMLLVDWRGSPSALYDPNQILTGPFVSTTAHTTYPSLDTTATRDPQLVRSDFSKIMRPKFSTDIGARAKEFWPAVLTDTATNNTRTINITVQPSPLPPIPTQEAGQLPF
jgi:hypothetical protein